MRAPIRRRSLNQSHPLGYSFPSSAFLKYSAPKAPMTPTIKPTTPPMAMLIFFLGASRRSCLDSSDGEAHLCARHLLGDFRLRLLTVQGKEAPSSYCDKPPSITFADSLSICSRNCLPRKGALLEVVHSRSPNAP